MRYCIFCLGLLFFLGCSKPEQPSAFFLGADLSYVNEMLDCGAEFRDNRQLVDPYALFAEKGCDIVRLRLWHNPQWTNYSNLKDVTRAMKAVKEAGMQVLLDFHYSDTWADPHLQQIPEAWSEVDKLEVLADSVYQYTYEVLTHLHQKGLIPQTVQVGNEINNEVLQPEDSMNTSSINWERNLVLINAGLRAVAEFAEDNQEKIGRMLHIAQPENALKWFAEAQGLTDYEWIGLSYYPKWSSYSLDSLSFAIDSLRTTYGKNVMIVETSYPYTLEDVDEANNVLGEDSLIPGFPASPEGQLAYVQELKKAIKAGGGSGVIYWEPAWVSTPCSTLWGKGSHWENATFFDASDGNESLMAFDFFVN